MDLLSFGGRYSHLFSSSPSLTSLLGQICHLLGNRGWWSGKRGQVVRFRFSFVMRKEGLPTLVDSAPSPSTFGNTSHLLPFFLHFQRSQSGAAFGSSTQHCLPATFWAFLPKPVRVPFSPESCSFLADLCHAAVASCWGFVLYLEVAC